MAGKRKGDNDEEEEGGLLPPSRRKKPRLQTFERFLELPTELLWHFATFLPLVVFLRLLDTSNAVQNRFVGRPFWRNAALRFSTTGLFSLEPSKRDIVIEGRGGGVQGPRPAWRVRPPPVWNKLNPLAPRGRCLHVGACAVWHMAGANRYTRGLLFALVQISSFYHVDQNPWLAYHQVGRLRPSHLFVLDVLKKIPADLKERETTKHHHRCNAVCYKFLRLHLRRECPTVLAPAIQKHVLTFVARAADWRLCVSMMNAMWHRFDTSMATTWKKALPLIHVYAMLDRVGMILPILSKLKRKPSKEDVLCLSAWIPQRYYGMLVDACPKLKGLLGTPWTDIQLAQLERLSMGHPWREWMEVVQFWMVNVWYFRRKQPPNLDLVLRWVWSLPTIELRLHALDVYLSDYAYLVRYERLEFLGQWISTQEGVKSLTRAEAIWDKHCSTMFMIDD